MAAPREHMKTLVKKRENLESEIKALNDVLESQKGVGVDGPLIDSDGFPRSDIDVYSVRHARHQLACLQNDYSALMAEIEEELYRIHAEAKLNQPPGTEGMDVDPQRTKEELRVPFAKIDRVDENSPASHGGFEVNDEVLMFGSVTADNFTGLAGIGTLVQHSKDKAISVLVRRGEKDVRLSLIPKAWSGRGLLGCNIVPLKR